ncbi:MAG: thiamine-phosphate kinase [Mariniblastus sp.]|nr:thiamine-phosphate kinase [Mariniblastus sp.]
MQEQEIIDWIESACHIQSDVVQLGIGDDAAILTTGKPTVWTTDQIAEGTHFDLDLVNLEQVGRKAIGVNLSDLAAMGARPLAALLTLQLPLHFTDREVHPLVRGLLAWPERFQFPIVGGDTNRWDGPLVVGATLLGAPWIDRDQPNRLWTKQGGKPGDVIFVSGSFGGSLLGSHCDFEPQIDLAEFLCRHYPVSAATDVSDSLALDLAHLARASQTGFEIDSRLIPISPSAVERSATTGTTALEHALYDGEDFQLIGTVPGEVAQALEQENRLPTPFRPIGRLTDEDNFRIIDSHGQRESLVIHGYQH